MRSATCFLAPLFAVAGLAAADPVAPGAYQANGVLAKGRFTAVSAVGIGANGSILVGGDEQVVVYDASGKELKAVTVGFPVRAVAGDAQGRTFVGGASGDWGRQKAAFAAYGPAWEKLDLYPAVAKTARSVSGLAIHQDTLVVFDGVAGRIFRFHTDGRAPAILGRDLARCCGILDGDLAADGSIYLAHLGKHRVEVFDAAGKAKPLFGKEGERPEQFTGCCNPVSLALTPEGNFVTTEKSTPRVKVYKPDGTLIALIPEARFSPECGQMDVAVDRKGNIYVADDGAQEVKMFSPVPAGEAAKPR